MVKVRHFKSKEAYRKFLAYGHQRTKRGLLVKAKPGRTSVFKATPGHQKIVISGRPHRVRHRFMPRGKKGFLNLIIGLLMGFMVVTIMITLIPGFVEVIDTAQNVQGLNCVGYNNTVTPSLSYNASIGSKSTIGCLAMKLYLPYLILAVLIGLVVKILYEKTTTPGYSPYG